MPKNVRHLHFLSLPFFFLLFWHRPGLAFHLTALELGVVLTPGVIFARVPTLDGKRWLAKAQAGTPGPRRCNNWQEGEDLKALPAQLSQLNWPNWLRLWPTKDALPCPACHLRHNFKWGLWAGGLFWESEILRPRDKHVVAVRRLTG